MAAGALSLESQLLPETSGLPSLAVGIRDIGNNTYNYANSGYHGRSYYLVGGRTPIQLATAPYPVRNLAYSIGIGAGGITGPFGSVAADLPLTFDGQSNGTAGTSMSASPAWSRRSHRYINRAPGFEQLRRILTLHSGYDLLK